MNIRWKFSVKYLTLLNCLKKCETIFVLSASQKYLLYIYVNELIRQNKFSMGYYTLWRCEFTQHGAIAPLISDSLLNKHYFHLKCCRATLKGEVSQLVKYFASFQFWSSAWIAFWRASKASCLSVASCLWIFICFSQTLWTAFFFFLFALPRLGGSWWGCIGAAAWRQSCSWWGGYDEAGLNCMWKAYFSCLQGRRLCFNLMWYDRHRYAEPHLSLK